MLREELNCLEFVLMLPKPLMVSWAVVKFCGVPSSLMIHQFELTITGFPLIPSLCGSDMSFAEIACVVAHERTKALLFSETCKAGLI
jgi:hypothetical protein